MAISELARKVFLTYFVTHIPATMLIDAQVVLPPRVVPTFARNALRWHISTNNDVLMAHQPAWLRSLVMCELVFQLPFFFVAISALRRRDEGAKGWLLAYGAHTRRRRSRRFCNTFGRATRSRASSSDGS